MSKVKIVEKLFAFPASEATIAAIKAAMDKPFSPPVKSLTRPNKRRPSHLLIAVNNYFCTAHKQQCPATLQLPASIILINLQTKFRWIQSNNKK